MILNIYIDGGARGNPGPAAAGVVIESVEPAFVLHEAGYFLGRATNNVAEYSGLVRGLELAVALKATEARIFSDSELMVKQIMGEYRVKSADLKPLYARATALLLKIDLWQIKHVYREENSRADGLANKAMDAKRDVILTSANDFLQGGANPSAKPAGTAIPVAPTTPAKPAKTTRRRGAGLTWTAALDTEPGNGCPAPCPATVKFRFGPETPQGFCVHAAQAVLEDGPLEWSKTHDPIGDAECRRCGVKIQIQLVNER